MRVLVLLFALAAVAGCRLEPGAPADNAATAEAPPATAPPTGAQGEFSDTLVPTTTPDGKPAVVLYVTEWCPYCAQAREFMTEEGVPHRVVDIEKDAVGQAEYQARGGDGGIPLVAVGERTIQGWSEEVATELLTEAGYK
ncbi:glutaredoxin family protein [Rubrivirga sp.]|uniref:glutaredoxin family protein n=1 Tax=Rubrivirga sp. TaxID=1885344 RepID=UPI003B5228E2